MVLRSETKERQLVKAARAFQRRSHARRESVAEAARKLGVSRKVFTRALIKPSKIIKKHGETTRIRRADRAKTAAAIEKRVKHHNGRAVRLVRQPIRAERFAERQKRKEANKIPQELIGSVGRRALRQNAEEMWFNSSQKSQNK